ncbi:hypothetical protein Patl1_29484 [Pistacia atlantica]|uniref:Uncharacterized protein n=1 Tax=Pistacia atlantica TaxID=434234 RepID=A0ACC1ABE6_9ROSI|nr:hypothetical protein Patl1_29484 [Pistacia atlantica]
MQEWEEWIPYGPSLEAEGFSQLKELSIVNCSKLVGRLPECLPSLEKLVVRNCEKLLVPVSAFPALYRLEIDGCKEIVQRSAANLSSLSSVVLSDISSQVFVEQFMQRLSKVEHLKIVGCKELTFLWQNGIGLLQTISQLHRLLLSVVAEEENQQQQWLACSCRLQYLELSDCKCLVKLPQELHRISSLRKICISNCPELFSFPETGLPLQLRFIEIGGCKALKSLPEAWIFESNTSLESIKISQCENLKLLPDDLHKLYHLSKIFISLCPNLVSFPEGGLYCKNLTEICMIGCEKLVALPNVIHNLTSLQHLKIKRCPAIVSFPENGFPTKLTLLEIEDLRILKQFFDWGLLRLTSLTRLFISGGCSDLVSFPQVPTSLTALYIRNFPNLEFISFSDQTFSYLEELYLLDCPKLKSFPGKGLSRSLSQLYIFQCPLLEQKCKKGSKYWSKIAHIPCVRINNKLLI